MFTLRLIVLFVYLYCYLYMRYIIFFFQAEDGIRDLVRSRGLGDVYKRQVLCYIDEGMMGILDDDFREELAELILLLLSRNVDLSLIHI